MALAEKQRVLAQLYTNAELRGQFFGDPMSVGMALGLTAEEASEVGRMSSSQVSLFAQSLERKRLNEISKMLPLTQRALGPRFGLLFQQFRKIQAPRRARTMHDELLDFAAFLQTTLRAGELEASLRDCVRYEAAWLKASRPNCRLLVRYFWSLSVDLAGSWKASTVSRPGARTLNPPPAPPRRGASFEAPVEGSPPGRGEGVGSGEENEIDPSPVTTPVLVVWFRLRARGRLRRFSFPLPWKSRRRERMKPQTS
jgi:hypothetical protein